MKVRMWLSVCDGSTGRTPYGGDGVLWYRAIDTGWLPTPYQDQIILWQTAGEDDPGEGPNWHVRRRHMHSDGQWNLDLTYMVVDPTTELWERLRAEMSRTGLYDWVLWETGINGDPVPQLEQGGWYRYIGGGS